MTSASEELTAPFYGNLDPAWMGWAEFRKNVFETGANRSKKSGGRRLELALQKTKTALMIDFGWR